MSRFRLIAALLAGAAILASAGAAQGQQLTGAVGPGFSISLVDSSGAPVKSLQPGDYTLQIHDLSTLHDFHLVGPGVDQATQVETLSDPAWSVTLAAGTYRFFCDAHPTLLKGSFTVGTQSPPSPPPPPTPVPKLLAHVGPGARIGLVTPSGAKVRQVSAGTYLLVVRDRSARDDFHLTGPGVNRKTGVAQKTTVDWKLTLQAGAYRYRSDAHPKLKGSFLVKPPG